MERGAGVIMIITNFASGELSRNLFGRIDLPQYFSGVSHLENFDVIPTGGIERRNGTKRIGVKDQEGGFVNLPEGRLIPFIVDRENSYLLYLTEGSIHVIDKGMLINSYYTLFYDPLYSVQTYEGEEDSLLSITGMKEGDVALVAKDENTGIDNRKYQYTDSKWVSVTDMSVYQDMKEINDVQYAQNYNTMILVHKDYAPIKIYLNDGQLLITPFNIFFNVEKKASYTLSEDESVIFDENYSTEQWLKSEGNFPGSVTFFNGRLVFAGTRNKQQRIFASRVNDVENFSTYKIYLSEEKKYVAVKGRIDLTKRDDIILDIGEGDKLFPLQDFLIDSPFFDPGVVILTPPHNKPGKDKDGNDILIQNVITMSSESKAIQSVDPDLLEELQEMADKFELYNSAKEIKIQIGDFVLKDTMGEYLDSAFIAIGASEIRFYSSRAGYGGGVISIPSDDVHLITVPNYLKNTIEYYANSVGNNSFSGYVKDENGLIVAAQKWEERIRETMTKEFNSIWYYGYPDTLKQDIFLASYVTPEGIAYDGQNMYFPFYTRKVIEDRYPSPEDGFTFEIASDMSDAIKWLVVNKNLIVGTETAEWIIPSEVHAASVRAILNSRYGSDNIQGTSIGDAVCFFQTGRKALVEYYIPQQDNNFRANNMAMLSKDMLHESPVRDFDFISAPYTKIFITRDSGDVVTLLYERSTGTFAWGRITTAGGKIKSVATLPGESGFDEVYLIVERNSKNYLEQLDERGYLDEELPVHADIKSTRYHKVFLDSSSIWTGNISEYPALLRLDLPNAPVSAVVYDETENKVYDKEPFPSPLPGHVMFIGYPFESIVRSMPVLANDQMHQNNIHSLNIRFLESFMPLVRSWDSEGRLVKEDSIPWKDREFSGVIQIPFPGVFGRDVFFEFLHKEPTCCQILAVNAEVN
jgi:hypothetical protein